MVPAHRLKQAPWRSVVLMSVCLSVMLIPSAAELLIYDRAAIARGELWRIFTAHAVHYSVPHLFNNMLALLPAVLLAETRYREDMMYVLVVSALAIGLTIFVCEPGMLRYAGASGIALGLITFVALRGIADKGRWRTVCLTVLAVVVVKLAAESLFEWQPVDWEREAGFVTVTLAHVTGAASGLLVWCVRFVPGKRSRLVVKGTIEGSQPQQI